MAGKKSNPSSKFRRIPLLTRLICEVLDTQEVRRLCRYLTLSPYDTEALDYDNEIVEQPDLIDSLLIDSIRDKNISKRAQKACLLPYRFSKDALEDNRVLIFVYCSEVGLSEANIEVDTMFNIDILYPLEIERLENYKSRPWEILIHLSNALDEYRICNKELADRLGNVEFNFSSNVISGKLASNSSMGILSIPVHVKSMGLRYSRF